VSPPSPTHAYAALTAPQARSILQKLLIPAQHSSSLKGCSNQLHNTTKVQKIAFVPMGLANVTPLVKEAIGSGAADSHELTLASSPIQSISLHNINQTQPAQTNPHLFQLAHAAAPSTPPAALQAAPTPKTHLYSTKFT